jgi:hypothetical protein
MTSVAEIKHVFNEWVKFHEELYGNAWPTRTTHYQHMTYLLARIDKLEVTLKDLYEHMCHEEGENPCSLERYKDLISEALKEDE